MFTQMLANRVLGSGLVDLLTGPHGVDRYTELVVPTWSLGDARARVASVERRTPRSVTLTLAPNRAFPVSSAASTSTSPSRSTAGAEPAVIHRPAPKAHRCWN
jgi:hypothetical protein